MAVGSADALVAAGLGRELPHRLIGPLDIRVARGEIVALVGSNGSGKTTFIRLALGIDRPSFGDCSIWGARVSPLVPPTDVGYVPDKAAFWDWMSAADNLRLFARDRSDVSAVLDRVGLADVAGRPVRTFSRGMRQRLSIGRALIGSPALLVMDEPTIALDDEAVRLLGEIIEEWRSRGRSALIASHDEAFVRAIHARVIRIDGAAAT
jgi:ABC-type multidrug transport system ATPase subunit